ncbi:4057_t:CDS:2 [Ambispora gerdemannii]|uniref:4057_t:CDS:1 n=1 Tax=Ambispora gerdemannii TaxID=144530 RepID=A0A9N9F2X0_9GLOM|nr:4057_t:CDS:2 [Ambispora gerdemannii]
MILPKYENTYSTSQSTNKMFLNQLEKIVDSTTQFLNKHQQVTILGVHGWLPEIAQGIWPIPSQILVDKMELAVRRYLNLGKDEGNITGIRLTGHGIVEDRAEMFLQRIQNDRSYVDKVSNANVIFIVGHSQGVPTSVLLLSRLIETGLVNPKKQHVALLLLAGISEGPTSRFEIGDTIGKIVGDKATSELFDFQISTNAIAKKYRAATQTALKLGVKILYFASGNDEVVPLHSALFSSVKHPSILRGIYVADEVYQDKRFIVDLVRLLIRIKNHGYSDQGLLNHISDALIGYLKDGGHNHISTEDETYMSAVKHLYESKTYEGVESTFAEFDYSKPLHLGRSYIPWGMRGLLSDEDLFKSEKIGPDVISLRKSFMTWDPRVGDIVAAELKLLLIPFGDTNEDQYIYTHHIDTVSDNVHAKL